MPPGIGGGGIGRIGPCGGELTTFADADGALAEAATVTDAAAEGAVVTVGVPGVVATSAVDPGVAEACGPALAVFAASGFGAPLSAVTLGVEQPASTSAAATASVAHRSARTTGTTARVGIVEPALRRTIERVPFFFMGAPSVLRILNEDPCRSRSTDPCPHVGASPLLVTSRAVRR